MDFLNPRLAGRRVGVLLHEGLRGPRGKTGLAFLRYSAAEVVAVIDRDAAGASLVALTGIDRPVPVVASAQEAIALGVDTLLIGIAPSGGILPTEWETELKEALRAGVSLVNGLHRPLSQAPDWVACQQPGQWIWDVRVEPTGLTIGSGLARLLPGARVLTVGTDMAIGKMSTTLELCRAARRQGRQAHFVGTGQAGLMIAGQGVALDAVRVDFAAGAVERALLQAAQDAGGLGEGDLLAIEGQGSLLHPGSTATLPLLRGSQPTHLILVHRAGQVHLRDLPHCPIPPLPDVVALYEAVARAAGTYAAAPVAAIALNTAHLSDAEARAECDRVAALTDRPCTDPVRYGAELLLASMGVDSFNQQT